MVNIVLQELTIVNMQNNREKALDLKPNVMVKAVHCLALATKAPSSTAR